MSARRQTRAQARAQARASRIADHICTGLVYAAAGAALWLVAPAAVQQETLRLVLVAFWGVIGPHSAAVLLSIALAGLLVLVLILVQPQRLRLRLLGLILLALWLVIPPPR